MLCKCGTTERGSPHDEATPTLRGGAVFGAAPAPAAPEQSASNTATDISSKVERASWKAIREMRDDKSDRSGGEELLDAARTVRTVPDRS
jgi:hypothetical protein